MSLTTLSGKAVPPLFYGTAWKKTNTTALVSLALKTGFRAIDTACQPRHYREDLVGEAIAQTPVCKREDLFIQTKFTLPPGQDPQTIPYDPKAKLEDQVRQSFAKSLQDLRTHYLDSVLLHSPAPTMDDTLEIINVLREFKEKAHVRHLGISNVASLRTLRTLCSELPPSTIQIVQNRFWADSNWDKDIRKYCKENGIVYQSFWTLTGNPDRLRSPVFHQLTARIKTTPECAWYRFCMQEGITVLDGTTSEEHMKQDLEVMTDKKFQLNESEM